MTERKPSRRVAADPYPWPLVGGLEPGRSALMVIDMQADFCAADGYMARLGADLGGLQAPIEPIRRALAAARGAGLTVVHTRQGYRADLADLWPHQRERSRLAGAEIGSAGPLGRLLVRGQPGWRILPELEPEAGEPVIDKTANGAFTNTDLAAVLAARGVRHIAFAGNTIDVCVHSTLREAADRGFECLLLRDACGALDPAPHAAAVAMVKVEGGVLGTVAEVARFEAALAPRQGG